MNWNICWKWLRTAGECLSLVSFWLLGIYPAYDINPKFDKNKKRNGYFKGLFPWGMKKAHSF